MLERIKSIFILKKIFTNVDEEIKLKLIKYNKSLQNNIDINLVNYILFKGKYLVYEKNTNLVKEFNIHNNLLIYEGEYLKGKRNGRGKVYDADLLIYEGEFKDGKRNGKGTEYDYGNKIFEGEYLNDKKWNGFQYEQEDNNIYIFKYGCGCDHFNSYYTRESIEFEGKKLSLYRYIEDSVISYYLNNNKYNILRDGKGFIKEYYYDNKLKYEGEYLNGEKNGKGKEFNIHGKLIFQGQYFNGKKWNGEGYNLNNEVVYTIKNGKGYVKEYYLNGKLKFEGEYLYGSKNGKGKEYFYNGNLKFEGHYLNGKKNGRGKEYDINGKLISDGEFLYNYYKKEEYLNPKFLNNLKDIRTNDIDTILFSGKFIDGIILNSKVKEYVYTCSGTPTLKFEGDYLNCEKCNGKAKQEKIEGLTNFIFTGEYKFGERYGDITEYTDHPILTTFTGRIKKGKKYSRGKEYAESLTKVIFEGDYINGERHGYGKEYDENGKLIFEGLYSKGKKNGQGTEYDSNGNIIYEGNYLNNNRIS